MLILGLQGSPRKGGNTDTFLAAFLEKAGQAGAAVKTIQVARAGIVPCKGCGYCETHGTCVIADDPMSTEIFGLLRQADLVVAALQSIFTPSPPSSKSSSTDARPSGRENMLTSSKTRWRTPEKGLCSASLHPGAASCSTAST
jgi:hypothetical protein